MRRATQSNSMDSETGEAGYVAMPVGEQQDAAAKEKTRLGWQNWGKGTQGGADAGLGWGWLRQAVVPWALAPLASMLKGRKIKCLAWFYFLLLVLKELAYIATFVFQLYLGVAFFNAGSQCLHPLHIYLLVSGSIGIAGSIVRNGVIPVVGFWCHCSWQSGALSVLDCVHLVRMALSMAWLVLGTIWTFDRAAKLSCDGALHEGTRITVLSLWGCFGFGTALAVAIIISHVVCFVHGS